MLAFCPASNSMSVLSLTMNFFGSLGSLVVVIVSSTITLICMRAVPKLSFNISVYTPWFSRVTRGKINVWSYTWIFSGKGPLSLLHENVGLPEYWTRGSIFMGAPAFVRITVSDQTIFGPGAFGCKLEEKKKLVSFCL